MLRHDFQPGKLVTGVTLLAAAALYLGDASDAWRLSWWVGIPVIAGGLALAVVAAAAGYGVRRRRSRSNESRENTDAPPSTSASQPMR